MTVLDARAAALANPGDIPAAVTYAEQLAAGSHPLSEVTIPIAVLRRVLAAIPRASSGRRPTGEALRLHPDQLRPGDYVRDALACGRWMPVADDDRGPVEPGFLPEDRVVRLVENGLVRQVPVAAGRFVDVIRSVDPSDRDVAIAFRLRLAEGQDLSDVESRLRGHVEDLAVHQFWTLLAAVANPDADAVVPLD